MCKTRVDIGTPHTILNIRPQHSILGMDPMLIYSNTIRIHAHHKKDEDSIQQCYVFHDTNFVLHKLDFCACYIKLHISYVCGNKYIVLTFTDGM